MTKTMNNCYICGEPIKGNVAKSPAMVECWKCTADKVERIEAWGKILKAEIRDAANLESLIAEFMMKKQATGEDLKKLRKVKGWSQADLGCQLGISQQAVHKMESGNAILPEKARILLKSIPGYGQPQFGCQIDADNKQVTDAKNGGQ